jgi:hypothetical protein
MRKKTAPNLAAVFRGHKGDGALMRRLCIVLVVTGG